MLPAGGAGGALEEPVTISFTRADDSVFNHFNAHHYFFGGLIENNGHHGGGLLLHFNGLIC